jgi:1,4-alpha-glucan branching enzyme
MNFLHPSLFAFAMFIAGCPAIPRPVSTDLPAASFAITAPDARTVTVAGSFNHWDPNSHPLSGPDRSGGWAATVNLLPGRYEYLFVINGNAWVLDPAALSVDNGLGERNSIVTVTGDQHGEK